MRSYRTSGPSSDGDGRIKTVNKTSPYICTTNRVIGVKHEFNTIEEAAAYCRKNKKSHVWKRVGDNEYVRLTDYSWRNK